MKRGFQTVADRILLGIAVLLVWHLAASIAGPLALATPLVTIRRLIGLLADPAMTADAAETAGAVARAALISVGGGILLGSALGSVPRAAAIAEPLLVGLYSLPKLTFYPVILLIFGLGLEAKVALGALHGIIPVVLFTLNGVRNIPLVLRHAATTMRLKPLPTAMRILIPAALPEVLAGVRLGLALTLLGTLVGEMFASQAGIGHALKQSMAQADSATITALALLVFLSAMTLDRAVLFGAQRLAPGGGVRVEI